MWAVVWTLSVVKVTSLEPYVSGNIFYQRGAWDPGNNRRYDILPRQSIMRDYLLVSEHSNDVKSLAHVVLSHPLVEEARRWVFAPETLVVHLRMGDNIQSPACWHRNCEFNGGEQNPLSRERFEACINTFPSFSFKRIILFGSFNGGGWNSHKDYSKKYFENVLSYFRQQNVTIESYVTSSGTFDWQTVDHDIVYISQSPALVCSGGTFSSMLGDLVFYNGGKTCGCEPDWLL